MKSSALAEAPAAATDNAERADAANAAAPGATKEAAASVSVPVVVPPAT